MLLQQMISKSKNLSPLFCKYNLPCKRKKTNRAPKGFQYLPKNYLWDEIPEPKTHCDVTGWNINSKRTGVIAQKICMMTAHNEYLQTFPVTILHVDDNIVTQIKTEDKEGFYSIQVGAGERKIKNTKKPQLGHYANVPNLKKPKRLLEEFRVTKESVVPIGTKLFAQHFIPGQFVDIRGKTVGKGFQGAMKRWGFGGGPASHGASKSHRSLGSTGACQDPGRVWKGKKMAGRMGHKNRTVKNLFLWKIDTKMNLLYVKGSVPGKPGTWLRVIDAKNKKYPKEEIPPFPTFQPKEGEEYPIDLQAKMKPMKSVDDYNIDYQEDDIESFNLSFEYADEQEAKRLAKIKDIVEKRKKTQEEQATQKIENRKKEKQKRKEKRKEKRALLKERDEEHYIKEQELLKKELEEDELLNQELENDNEYDDDEYDTEEDVDEEEEEENNNKDEENKDNEKNEAEDLFK
eukprot:TRINITY_DN865_c2_g1_i1.p1 TRINITY_DN865_c2_g1~~TRINITY_DN865_c2_g1_i1.p1  ORF type:complete len:459 (+),score=193.64 TRINITY_DN865_c2_g1_i1:33-1409(+)